jgi:C4-dicarboxylate-specific signal transduction histidine kinase
MSIFQNRIDEQEIMRIYFSDPDKRIHLKKDEVLIEQGALNERMFYVKSGHLSGYLPDEHISEPVFEAHSGSFLGVYSYLSDDHRSYSQVIATSNCELYYFDEKLESLKSEASSDLFIFLFNIAVIELRSRQHFAAKMANERQEAMNQLIKSEKLVTLGQLAAGLAHELNNTIGSFTSNLGQLESDISNLINDTKHKDHLDYYHKGLNEGLNISSKQERALRKEWSRSLDVASATLKKMIRAGLTQENARNNKAAASAAELWQIGHILHDLKIASNQASHVVNSIKTMGIANQHWSDDVNINDTIKEALVILKSITRYAEFNISLDETISPIEACHGELVQVWVNLIKNAVENLRHHDIKNPQISVSTKNLAHIITIEIADNGTGIDEAIMSKVYEPSFTTKVEGLSLGLGLGLTIVQRIISEHQGAILLNSQPGKTVFKIELLKRR